jgi:hypothetical protein
MSSVGSVFGVMMVLLISEFPDKDLHPIPRIPDFHY